MGWLIRKLRDLDAALTSYGQCVRCRRSWRYAGWVMVEASSRDGFFCLCIRCWRDVARAPLAGLNLQGWADKAIADNESRGSTYDRRAILGWYGMAWRFPVELDMSFGDGPWTYRVRVHDTRRRNRMGRADLSPTGERVQAAPAKGFRGHTLEIGTLHEDGPFGVHPAADGADGRDGHAS